MSELAIEASGLVKVFGETRAVAGVDLAVRPGPSTASSGPNGAGKTTTIRCWPRCSSPTAGTARVLGHDVVARGRRRAPPGQPDRPVRLGRRGAHRHGRTWCCSAGCSASPRPGARARADELLDAFDLTDAADPPGQDLLRRHAPAPRHRRQHRRHARPAVPRRADHRARPPQPQPGVGDRPRAGRREGTTVLLTTQYLDEADQLADRIAVIDHGKVIAEGTSGELKASVGLRRAARALRDPRRERRGARCSPSASGSRCTSRPTRRRSPPWAATRSGSAEALAELAAPGSRWASSRSASRAWTRCSWR